MNNYAIGSWILVVGGGMALAMWGGLGDLFFFLSPGYVFDLGIYLQIFYFGLVWPALKWDNPGSVLTWPDLLSEAMTLQVASWPLLVASRNFSSVPLMWPECLGSLLIILLVILISTLALSFISSSTSPLYLSGMLFIMAGIPYIHYLNWHFLDQPKTGLYIFSPFGANYALFHQTTSVYPYFIVWALILLGMGGMVINITRKKREDSNEI